jgi:LmbE family N-acetylglucosaminyl deacetylase
MDAHFGTADAARARHAAGMSNELDELPTDWTSALCVVAHPDDMEFGAAGAVATWTADGKDVSYLLVTRGEAGCDGLSPDQAAKVRQAEQEASAAIVGVKELEFLDYADGVIEYGLPLRRDITAAIRRHRPQLVVGYNHHEMTFTAKRNSADHRHTGQALLDAVADAGNRWVFPDLGLEPWPGVKYVVMSSSPQPSHAVDVSGAIDKAVASLEAHREYLAQLGFTGSVRDPLVGLFSQTGQRFGGRPAIAFEMIAR